MLKLNRIAVRILSKYVSLNFLYSFKQNLALRFISFTANLITKALKLLRRAALLITTLLFSILEKKIYLKLFDLFCSLFRF